MKLDVPAQDGAFEKSALGLVTNQTVAGLTRPIAPLNINDSIPRAIETLRQSTLSQIPIVNGKHLLMLLSETEIAQALLSLPSEEQARYRLQPLSALLPALGYDNHEEPILRTTDPLAAGVSVFRNNPDVSAIGVIDSKGEYFGILCRNDLLAMAFRTLAPTRVGGMATPLGVYLTDGVESGGVGTVALMLAGATLTSLFLIAVVVTNALGMIALRHHIDLSEHLIRILMPIMPNYAVSFVYDLQAILPLIVMMLLLRAIPVAGYHAAEHQVVHCIERGEPLIPENVAQMPRPHPRCGTNLVAAVILFSAYLALFGALTQVSSAVVPAAILTFLSWRQLGTFLQQYVTTRTASREQLESGITAGEDLLLKYRLNTNRTIKIPQRIWRMGFIQMLCGCGLVGVIIYLIAKFVPTVQPYLQGIN